MKVLHVLSSDDGYGSALCFKELLVAELRHPELVPIVVTPKHNKINEFCDSLKVINYSVKYGQAQIPKHDVWWRFCIKYLLHYISYHKKERRAEDEICRIIHERKIDVVHTNSCVIDTGAICANKCSVPHVWHLREFGKEDFNFYPIRYHMVDRMNAITNTFIAVSNSVKKSWIEKGLNPAKIEVLYDGVEATAFKCPKRDYKNGIKLVMTGSFCEAKGQMCLVQALALLQNDTRNFEVSFYGKTEGAYFEDVRQYVVDNNLVDFVKFEGYSNDIPNELTKYHIGVLCSRAEAFGRVTAEYMLSGLCVIAPRSGANVELLSDGESGLLYDPDDPSSLAEKIKLLLGRIDMIEKIGVTARKLADEKYDIGKNANDIIRAFKNVSLTVKG